MSVVRVKVVRMMTLLLVLLMMLVQVAGALPPVFQPPPPPRMSEGGRSSRPSPGHVTDLWGLEGSMSPEGKRELRRKGEIGFYSCCFVLVTKQRVTLRVSLRRDNL